mgnify:CR=1 FL=1|jgi:hypothetical protein
MVKTEERLYRIDKNTSEVYEKKLFNTSDITTYPYFIHTDMNY